MESDAALQQERESDADVPTRANDGAAGSSGGAAPGPHASLRPDTDAATGGADGTAVPPQHPPSQGGASDGDNDEPPSLVASLASVTSPPYWGLMHNQSGRAMNESSLSVDSVQPGAITLRDNEQDEEAGDDARGAAAGPGYARDRNRACWARSVEVTDSVLMNGSTTNIGAFVVWNIRVRMLNGSNMNIRKRYSEFDDFRKQLVQTFPDFEAAVPDLPAKSVISRFRPSFLEKRRIGLQYFLNCILLNPEFSGSPILNDFLFS